MGRTLRAIKRVVILLSVWIITGLVWYHVAGEYSYHQALSSEVAQLEADRDMQAGELTRSLVNEDELRNDPDRKIEMLKKEFGFTRLDETPILILPEQNN
jgi:hypothetical protein